MPDLSAHYAVTGGAGFIGSSLVAHLVEQGAKVTVLDNLVNGSRKNLKEAAGDDVRLIVGDVRDEDALRGAFEGVDVVFHLACLGVRHSLRRPLENHEVNATGTLLTLAAAREAEVTRFVHVSSSEVYGTARRVPMNEEHPTFPHTVYGASKLAGECYARAFHDTLGLPVTILRPFNAYGPRSHHEGDSGEVIPRFVLRALAGLPPIVFGDGTQTRDFTYVADTARAIAEVGLHPEAVGETVNLGFGAETAIADLARLVISLAGVDLVATHEAPRPGDVQRLFADGTKARVAFGYTPQVSLADGLQRLLAWYAALGVDPATLLDDSPTVNWE